MKCGHDNEANANFCRNCGESITIVKGTQTSKDQVEFVPQKQRRLESDVAGGYIVGVVFIVVGIKWAAILGISLEIGVKISVLL
jgi:uncharacterized membrane protein YvbJ